MRWVPQCTLRTLDLRIDVLRSLEVGEAGAEALLRGQVVCFAVPHGVSL